MIAAYMISIFAAAGGASAVFILTLKNKAELRDKLYKIFALILAGVFALRIMLAPNAYCDIYALKFRTSVESLSSPFLIFLSMFLIWANIITVIALALSPFFKLKISSNLITFFLLPTAFLNVCFFFAGAVLLDGDAAFSGFNFRTLVYALEIALCLSLCLIHVWHNGVGAAICHRSEFKKITWSEVRPLLLCVIPLLLVSMPTRIPQIFFGEGSVAKLTGMTFQHRLFIYPAFIVPILLYLALKNRSLEIRRYAMLLTALPGMVVFTLDLYYYRSFFNPVALPLHLCNTAMYIIPLCLIFKWEKLFYFTYFINVLGAFLAITLPNYGTGSSPISFGVIHFYASHYQAFFMPLVIVALGIFPRPKIKQFKYSMIAFAVYFVSIIIINAWFTNYGTADYFFLNSNFVAKKFSKNIELAVMKPFAFNIGKLNFEFFPLYQFIFLIVYTAAALGMWFLYENGFIIADKFGVMMRKKRKIRLDEIMLRENFGESGAAEPINKDGEDMIKLIDFTKSYGGKGAPAVDKASFEVYAGEIFGFLGPNGAGKSTVIKSLVGLQPITEGRIEVCGFDVETQSIQTKRLIGYVPDHYSLYEKLTGREYINYIADIYEIETGDRDERINRFLNIFELNDAFDSQIKTYSHGMKQKIAIIAALVHDPKVWILDEPLTGLDPNSIFQVKETMKEHAANGNIVFFSSHIMDVVERLCHRVAIIRKGKIIAVKKMEEIERSGMSLEKYYLETIRTGETPDNLQLTTDN